MRHFFGDRLWDCYSHFYDPVTRLFFNRQRRNYIDLFLGSSVGLEDLLVVGVGTGEDLLFIDDSSIRVVGIDYSDGMLEKARLKSVGSDNISFMKMDAHNLIFPSNSFSGVLLPLILAVVKEPLLCLKEAVRVLRPGGRMLVFDKFVDRFGGIGIFRRLVNVFTEMVATSINVDFYELLSGVDLKIIKEESSLILFKTFLLEKGV